MAWVALVEQTTTLAWFTTAQAHPQQTFRVSLRAHTVRPQRILELEEQTVPMAVEHQVVQVEVD
jgi:hypothetical protein